MSIGVWLYDNAHDLIAAATAGLWGMAAWFLGYGRGKGEGYLNGWLAARNVYDAEEKCLVCVAYVRVEDRWVDDGVAQRDLHKACAEQFVGPAPFLGPEVRG